MSINSYAQNFEDVMLWRALSHIENGVYIDIGAQDPVIDSVSLAFHERGWKGVHVEPTPHYANMLRKQRPNDAVIQASVGGTTDLITFFEIPNTGISTADIEIANRHRASGFDVKEIIVSSVTLETVFKKSPGNDIHWLKIDVEGYEEQVLSSWGRSSDRPWIIVIESTLPLTRIESHELWEPLLFKHGYKPVYFDGLNRFYISEEHPELAASFTSPPNVFDGFTVNGTASTTLHKLLEERHSKQLNELQIQHKNEIEFLAKTKSKTNEQEKNGISKKASYPNAKKEHQKIDIAKSQITKYIEKENNSIKLFLTDQLEKLNRSSHLVNGEIEKITKKITDSSTFTEDKLTTFTEEQKILLCKYEAEIEFLKKINLDADLNLRQTLLSISNREQKAEENLKFAYITSTKERQNLEQSTEEKLRILEIENNKKETHLKNQIEASNLKRVDECKNLERKISEITSETVELRKTIEKTKEDYTTILIQKTDANNRAIVEMTSKNSELNFLNIKKIRALEDNLETKIKKIELLQQDFNKQQIEARDTLSKTREIFLKNQIDLVDKARQELVAFEILFRDERLAAARAHEKIVEQLLTQHIQKEKYFSNELSSQRQEHKIEIDSREKYFKELLQSIQEDHDKQAEQSRAAFSQAQLKDKSNIEKLENYVQQKIIALKDAEELLTRSQTTLTELRVATQLHINSLIEKNTETYNLKDGEIKNLGKIISSQASKIISSTNAFEEIKRINAEKILVIANQKNIIKTLDADKLDLKTKIIKSEKNRFFILMEIKSLKSEILNLQNNEKKYLGCAPDQNNKKASYGIWKKYLAPLNSQANKL